MAPCINRSPCFSALGYVPFQQKGLLSDAWALRLLCTIINIGSRSRELVFYNLTLVQCKVFPSAGLRYFFTPQSFGNVSDGWICGAIMPTTIAYSLGTISKFIAI